MDCLGYQTVFPCCFLEKIISLKEEKKVSVKKIHTLVILTLLYTFSLSTQDQLLYFIQLNIDLQIFPPTTQHPYILQQVLTIHNTPTAKTIFLLNWYESNSYDYKWYERRSR